MTATHDVPPAALPDVDVLVVGAGLSGIGAAVHLQTDAPGATYEILEARAASGGTWDLFRYPGVRSDSDMFTLGYSFRPWQGGEPIAAGGDILDYLRETAAEHHVDEKISYHRRVEGADWSSTDQRWTVQVRDTESDEVTTRTCRFLYLCAGYYSYDEGYTPELPGREEFGGAVVHPQHWPEDLDVTGRRVVVVGSGATAVTLVPALAETAAQVTMLQRSPSYVMAMPTQDAVADLLRRVLPHDRALAAIRWKNVRQATAIYWLSRRYPQRVRRFLRWSTERMLPEGYDVGTHFTPSYDPWDQRMCLSPGGDLFAAIRGGTADVVTDHVAAFTPGGLRLRSGEELAADVVVMATGLNLLPMGGVPVRLDGEELVAAEHVTYKGAMLSDVPNLAFALGYTNASWTLKVDLVSAWVARLVGRLAREGGAVVPRLPEEPLPTSPFIEMSSGYFERSRDRLPLQGDRAPWRLAQSYLKDAALWRPGTDDSALEHVPARAPAGSPT